MDNIPDRLQPPRPPQSTSGLLSRVKVRDRFFGPLEASDDPSGLTEGDVLYWVDLFSQSPEWLTLKRLERAATVDGEQGEAADSYYLVVDQQLIGDAASAGSPNVETRELRLRIEDDPRAIKEYMALLRHYYESPKRALTDKMTANSLYLSDVALLLLPGSVQDSVFFVSLPTQIDQTSLFSN